MDYLVLTSSDTGNIVKICLNEGGRITNLIINRTEIITDKTNRKYTEDFTSAILFPFANRIKNGEYIFNETKYKLHCNEKSGKNAIHGLVYDKYFEVVSKEANQDFASVTLSYEERDGCDGFPFKYAIILKYTLNKDGLSLKLAAKNIDEKSFPYTMGWHPYFLSSDLSKSKLSFQSKKKFKIDSNGIVIDKEDFSEDMAIDLKHKTFDDAFVLDSHIVNFITPSYQLQLKSSAINKFLQIYTPQDTEAIAIEPMTGVADSFNNQIGKQVLKPNEEVTTEWTIKISTN